MDRDDEKILINFIPFACLISSGFLWYLFLGAFSGF